MTPQVPFWAEVIVAALLVLSGMFVVISAAGFLRLQDFFLRMHPPALAYSFGSWTVTLASILYFSMLESRLLLHPWLIIIMLAITVPVTTLMLARAALFRRRVEGTSDDTPPPLSRGTNVISTPDDASAGR
jgi:multicomponent K+:H+ antiporter subunit G